MATALPSTEEDLTTCSVCREVYNVNRNCPKFLSCHHTFCLACIGNIVTHGVMIRCPTCRVFTTLPTGNTPPQLRTNGHALKLAELVVRAAKDKTRNVAQSRSDLVQETAKQEKADKHLKVVVKSLDKLTTCSRCKQKFANNTKLKPKFLSCHHSYCNGCLQDVEEESDSVECCACRTLTSRDVHLQNNHYALKLVELEKQVATLQTEQSRYLRNSSELEREIAGLQQDLRNEAAARAEAVAALPEPVVPQTCYLTFHAPGVFSDEDYEITLETAPGVSPRLADLFHSYCNEDSTINFVGSTFQVSVPGMFVKFGKWERPCDDIDPILEDEPMIQERGDVGLYCQDVNAANVWDLVILLGDYREQNLRRAPLVARLIQGFDFCEDLPYLKVNERHLVKVSEVELCDA